MWVKLAAGKNKSMSRMNWKSCQISTGDYVAKGYKAPRLDTAGVSCHISMWLAIAYLLYCYLQSLQNSFLALNKVPPPSIKWSFRLPHFRFSFFPSAGLPYFFLSFPLCCIASVQPRPYRTTYPSNSDIRPFSVRMKEIQFLDVEKGSGDWRSWR